MKKVIYLSIALWLTSFFSCVGFGHGSGDPQVPCDNSLAPLSVSLDFTGTYYLCTQGVYGSSAYPPSATNFNYITTPSATSAVGALANPDAYLCQITSKNDQTASAYCTMPGMTTFYWTKPGLTQTVSHYQNYNTDATVDYYDVCAPCSATIPEGRPWFSGIATVPKGVNQPVNITLQTNKVYVGTNCQ